jgi:hypothetical protein
MEARLGLMAAFVAEKEDLDLRRLTRCRGRYAQTDDDREDPGASHGSSKKKQRTTG